MTKIFGEYGDDMNIVMMSMAIAMTIRYGIRYMGSEVK